MQSNTVGTREISPNPFKKALIEARGSNFGGWDFLLGVSWLFMYALDRNKLMVLSWTVEGWEVFIYMKGLDGFLLRVCKERSLICHLLLIVVYFV